jgi:hypothetical protein
LQTEQIIAKKYTVINDQQKNVTFHIASAQIVLMKLTPVTSNHVKKNITTAQKYIFKYIFESVF